MGTIEHCVEAYNTAVESTNRMHDDDVARTFGFRGGLVPGVDVWAYLVHPCVDRWGDPFLRTSTMEARFVSPVYDGERVVAALTEGGDLSVVGPDGSLRAQGSAALLAPDDLPPVKELPAAERTGSPPPAGSDTLAVGTVLPTLRFTFDGWKAARYLGEIRETSELFDGGAVCHPGFLARCANMVLHRNVVLGPWIHVGTQAWHRGVARDGAELETRAVVAAEYERAGHRFVDLDVEIAADGVPVWSAFHTAIWQPRSR